MKNCIATALIAGALGPSGAVHASRPAVPAETVCTSVPEPQFTGVRETESVYEAELTLEQGRPVALSFKILQGLKDRRAQRAVIVALSDANRAMACGDFTGKVSRRHVVPATPVPQP